MNTLLRLASLVVFSLLIAAATPAQAEDRTAEAILADLEKVEYPMFDGAKRDDKEYVEGYIAARTRADQQRAALILELYKADPKHEKVEKLLPERWSILMRGPVVEEGLDAEMDAVIAADPKSKLAIEAQYLRTETKVQKNVWAEEPNIAAGSEAVEAFIKAAPTDNRAARLLGMLAEAHETGSAEQIALYERIRKEYPESSSAKYAAGKIRRVTSIGKPFELSFHDAITGETVDMKNLRGKVVVIDFWATWCGPCVAEMPHMKELYAQHREKGVEFIGVSLDNPEDKGGLEKLKKFVAEKEIPWPQYYQGNGWESEFSTGWGINSIPSIFIVDKKGNLHSTEARGKLEELIPKLLAE